MELFPLWIASYFLEHSKAPSQKNVSISEFSLYRIVLALKPGLYSERRSKQTQLRKWVYADTRVMWFKLRDCIGRRAYLRRHTQ